MGKILVTGATGTVGREVVKSLRSKNVAIKAAIHQLNKASILTEDSSSGKGNVEYVVVNYDDPKTITKALEDVEKIFLLTPAMTTPSEGERIAISFIDQAKQLGISHIVRLSAMGVKEEDTSSHRRIEKYLEESGVPYTHLRPNFFMQNFNTEYFFESIKHGEIPLCFGSAKISFVDARDIGEVAATILTNEGHYNKAYTLTGKEVIDHYEIASILSKTLSREVTYTNPLLIRRQIKCTKH